MANGSIHLRHEFVRCISDPDLYAKFVAFNLDDQLARNRILFYETVEAFEDLLSHTIPDYHRIRYNNNSYALQRFVTRASNKDVSHIPIPVSLISQVHSIYDVYISLDATIEIGLPNDFHWTITKLVHAASSSNQQSSVTDLPCSLFDDAVDTILNFLFEDVFLRFHSLQNQPRSHSLRPYSTTEDDPRIQQRETLALDPSSLPGFPSLPSQQPQSQSNFSFPQSLAPLDSSCATHDQDDHQHTDYCCDVDDDDVYESSTISSDYYYDEDEDAYMQMDNGEHDEIADDWDAAAHESQSKDTPMSSSQSSLPPPIQTNFTSSLTSPGYSTTQRRHSLPTESLATHSQNHVRLPEPMDQASRQRYEHHIAKRQSRRLQLDLFLAETAYLDSMPNSNSDDVDMTTANTNTQYEQEKMSSSRKTSNVTPPLSAHPSSALPAIMEEGSEESDNLSSSSEECYACAALEKHRAEVGMDSPVSDDGAFPIPSQRGNASCSHDPQSLRFHQTHPLSHSCDLPRTQTISGKRVAFIDTQKHHSHRPGYPSPPPSHTSMDPPHLTFTSPTMNAPLIHYEDVPFVQSRRGSGSGLSLGTSASQQHLQYYNNSSSSNMGGRMSLAIHHNGSLQVPQSTSLWVMSGSSSSGQISAKSDEMDTDYTSFSSKSSRAGTGSRMVPRRMNRRQSRESLQQAVHSLRQHRQQQVSLPTTEQQPHQQVQLYSHVRPIVRPDSLYSIDPMLPPSTDLMEALQKVGANRTRRHSMDEPSHAHESHRLDKQSSQQSSSDDKKSNDRQETRRQRSFGNWFFWRRLGTASLPSLSDDNSKSKQNKQMMLKEEGKVSQKEQVPAPPVKVHHYKKLKKKVPTTTGSAKNTESPSSTPSPQRFRIPPTHLKHAQHHGAHGPDAKMAILHATIPSTFAIQQHNVALTHM